MKKIYVVRHGEDEDNAARIFNGHRNASLTQRGQEQVQEAALRLRDMDRHIEVIMTSPLRRATQSAGGIARVLLESGIACRVTVEDDLIERNFGILTGKPVSETEQYATATVTVDGRIYVAEAPDAESFPDLLERARRVLSRLRLEHAGKVAVMVTHGHFGRMLWAAYHDRPWEEALTTVRLDNAGILELSGRP